MKLRNLQIASPSSSENSGNLSGLENTINELKSQIEELSVEPPPPPISEPSNEGVNQKLIDTVENLEKLSVEPFPYQTSI